MHSFSFFMKHKKQSSSFLFKAFFFIVGLTFLIFIFLPPTPTDTTSYHTKLLSTMKHASDFKQFSDALFCYEVTSDSVTCAYNLRNPKTFHIPTLTPTLTAFSQEEYEIDKSNLYHMLIKQLHTFKEENLNISEQLTYDLLEQSLSLSSSLEEYPYYQELLGPSSGVQANLPVTLGEYPLKNERDINIYFTLLSQVPAYFSHIISYEKKRELKDIPSPLFLRHAASQKLYTMLEGFKEGDNSFLDTFEDRINQIDSLNKKQRLTYIEKNKKAVERYIIPAYEMLYEYITSSPDSKEQKSFREETNLSHFIDENIPYGLCSLPKGKSYYEQLVKQATGSSKNVTELIQMTDCRIAETLDEILSCALTNPKLYHYYSEHPFESYYDSPEAIVENLSLMIRKDYPVLSNTPDYQIKTVTKSLAPSLSPAFYMIPAMDDYTSNTIYINPLYTSGEKGNLFPTLAHEGFPGHLYQTVYFNETNPLPIRQMLDYPGYVEGWATYVEMNSYTFIRYPEGMEQLSTLYQADSILSLALSSRIDFGVNYEGWTLADTRKYFENLGFNSYYAPEIYSYVVESPANYLSYFIGYLEILDVKQYYKNQKMEDYREKDFHSALLSIGPADFNTIKKYIIK